MTSPTIQLGPANASDEVQRLRLESLHAALKHKTRGEALHIADAKWSAVATDGWVRAQFGSLTTFRDYCAAVAAGHPNAAAQALNAGLLAHIHDQLAAHSRERNNDSIDAIAASAWGTQASLRAEFASFDAFRAYCRGVARGRVRFTSDR